MRRARSSCEFSARRQRSVGTGRQQPDRNIISWLAEVDEDRVFISLISFAEIRRGVEMLRAGRRRERLAAWLAEDLPVRFEARILDIDPHVWGVVMAPGQKIGLTLGSMDAFVDATGYEKLTLNVPNVQLTIGMLNKRTDGPAAR